MNEKKRYIGFALLAAFCVPVSFLSVWWDLTRGSSLMYLLSALYVSALCVIGKKHGQGKVLGVGNVLSSVVSQICLLIFQTEDWSWYFKPFRAVQVLWIVTLLVALLQWCLWQWLHKERDPYKDMF